MSNNNKAKLKVFKEFYKQFTIKNYKKGEMIVWADDDPKGIFCLTKGYVRQYSISKAGFELTLHILRPVSYFPMVWALQGTPNIYYYKALTPVRIGCAPRDQVVNFIKDKPSVIFELMSELLEDYAQMNARMEHLVFSDAYRRVISVLLYIAVHFGEKSKRDIIVRQGFTQQDIATLAGVAVKTAIIEMSKLENLGLVKLLKNSIIFRDTAALESELSRRRIKS